MQSGTRFILFATVLLLSISSCSRYNKLLKSNNMEEKLKAAERYYAKKDYFRALSLYEQLQNSYAATDKAEEILFYNAYCNFALENYTIAGYLFKTYVETYPGGKRTEECYFLYASCIMRDSYPPELDPSNTIKAIDEFKAFASQYPESKYMQECNNNLDMLRAKLAEKAYRTAKLYYKTEEYKSAIVALKNAVKDYPDLAQKEELEFLVVKSNYLLARNSVDEKKKERLEATLQAYQEFIENYPESRYRKEAESLRIQSSLLLKKYQTTN